MKRSPQERAEQPWKIMRHGLKILPLDLWMELPASELRSIRCKPTSARFNRNGQYYDRIEKYWWFEVNGRAYTRNGEIPHFLYSLRVAGYEGILSERELLATKTLIATTRNTRLKKLLQDRLRCHKDIMELRALRRIIDSQKLRRGF